DAQIGSFFFPVLRHSCGPPSPVFYGSIIAIPYAKGKRMFFLIFGKKKGLNGKRSDLCKIHS
ncbi:MAG: hypothetical protein J6S45_01640, partial [Firmicutes bacterium]|nr:hypothetical protein [Bacillota bacterium]